MPVNDSHPYVPATPGDSRSPCPALNALANHGYLPRDGRNVTASQLITAIEQQYKLDAAFTQTLVYGGLAKCGHWDGLSCKLDLHDLAKHNVIEHDGSLVHDDTAPGETFAPTRVDPDLLHQLLDTSDSDFLTLHDLCQAQVTRQDASRPIGSVPAVVSKGELDLIYEVFGIVPGSKEASETATNGGKLVVPKSYLKQWLGQERLPDGWKGPVNAITLTSLVSHIHQIGGIEKEIKMTDKTDL
ncbi:Cloroperoxidase [Dichomitus squalens]|uniref:Cloroperoxidase n=2 Tax=Dichomitus squalens TaxID=114155 RepID=A0A4Q9Q965_9APHY|nr:Cloroperoxidase [Dichomitus squalens LYAD-421 SS1]EJF61120.1 Cloroperoxidase [Dichomitus squalens LYAD-421 SS1]TBU49368.1 Cloroperoxidase [Dichomitus squalens]TBU64035.1 Cloroperoxidase [Dichomitus squalens]